MPVLCTGPASLLKTLIPSSLSPKTRRIVDRDGEESVTSMSWMIMMMMMRRRLFCTARMTPTATATATTATMMKVKDKKSLSYLRRRLIDLGYFKEGNVIETLNGWVNEGKSVDKLDLIPLVDQLRNHNKYNHAIQIMDWMDGKGWDLSHGDYALRLDLISRTKGVHSAEDYFTSLPEPAKNKYTYAALLHCYCHEKMAEKAIGLVKKMKEFNFEFTSSFYNDVMSMYLKVGEPEKVPPLIQEMVEEYNITPDIYTYNILLNSYASLKDIQGAERVIEEIKASGYKCDWSTYASLANVYVQTGLFEKADSALKELEKLGDLPDRRAYHTLITLYSQVSNKLGVHRVWQSLHLAFPKITNLSYLTILQALSRLGDIDGLKKYFHEWESGSSAYDIRVANVLIESYLSRDMVKEADLVLDGATKKGAKPNFRTLEMFMKFYLENRQMDLALKKLDAACSKTEENEWQPSQETVSSLLEYFEQQKDTENAEKLFKSLRKVNCVDDKVYRSLLRTYIAAGKAELQMLQRIREDGIEMSSETKKLLVKVCPN